MLCTDKGDGNTHPSEVRLAGSYTENNFGFLFSLHSSAFISSSRLRLWYLPRQFKLPDFLLNLFLNPLGVSQLTHVYSIMALHLVSSLELTVVHSSSWSTGIFVLLVLSMNVKMWHQKLLIHYARVMLEWWPMAVGTTVIPWLQLLPFACSLSLGLSCHKKRVPYLLLNICIATVQCQSLVLLLRSWTATFREFRPWGLILGGGRKHTVSRECL